MRNWRVLTPLALLLSAGPSALAQQAAAGDDLSELMALLNTPVVSASKSEQTIGQAPAKIVAITAEDIRRRGYQDLEEIFHDLAGMDFAFGRGVEWSTVFMRGMRTDNTDHFLLIWDGVIQNDTWKYNVWLSRQYPLLNIERIEVMYGPSSLLYGANAFGGIVNIILKKPKDVNGIAVQAGGGSFKTRWTEVNFGKEMGDWRVSANGRYFRSDEMDMNDKSWVDNAGRRRYHNWQLSRDGITSLTDPSGYVAGLKVVNGVPQWRKDGVDVPFDGRAYGDTKDWWMQAGVGYKGFELRAYAWYRHEMEDSWYVPIRRMHGPWTPQGSAIYLSHDLVLNSAISMKSYLRTVSSGLDPEESYDAGFSRTIRDPSQPNDLKNSSLGTVDFYKLSNREWRAGQQFNYTVPKINSVFGWEYVAAKNYEDYNIRRLSSGPWAYTKQHDERNIAAYANIQADPSTTISIAAGFRYDYNYLAGETGGFGHLYTGRLATVITPNDQHRFKVIYGQAFQAPSPWQKFATVVNDRVAGGTGLKPERLASTELIWEYAPIQKWRNNFSLFYNQISEQIVLGIDAASGFNQLQNKGNLKIFGQEFESRYYFDAKNSVYLNATLNKTKVQAAFDTNPVTRVVFQVPGTGQNQGGLANKKLNIGADLLFAGHWSLNLRGHYVGARDVSQLAPYDPRTYAATAVLPNGLLASSAATADSYFTMDAVLTWVDAFKGMDMRLGVYNLANKEYYDPGTRIPDGRGNNALIIQQPLRAFVGFTYKF